MAGAPPRGLIAGFWQVSLGRGLVVGLAVRLTENWQVSLGRAYLPARR